MLERKISDDLLEWKRECEEYTLLSNIDTFALNLFNVSHALEQILEDRENNDDDK